MISITLNGEEKRLPSEATVATLLSELQLVSGRVAVERNRAVVPRAAHPTTRLEAGDVIEVVHFVGGG